MGLDSGGKVKSPAVDMQIHHWPMRARTVYKVGERFMRLGWLNETPGLPLLDFKPVYLAAMRIYFLKFIIIDVFVIVIF